MSISSSRLADVARQLVATEHGIAERAAQRVSAGQLLLTTASAVIDLCQERISAMLAAFEQLLARCGEPQGIQTLSDLGKATHQQLQQLRSNMFAAVLGPIDHFGMPLNAPVLGQELRLQAAARAQSFSPDLASSAPQMPAPGLPTQSHPPCRAASPADRPDQAPRSGTA
jgi:hypothetical protein